jgi:hypothetical protein
MAHGYYRGNNLPQVYATDSISPAFESPEPWELPGRTPDGLCGNIRSGVSNRALDAHRWDTQTVSWKPAPYQQPLAVSGLYFDYLKPDGTAQTFVNQFQSTSAAVVRDDLIGVATLGVFHNNIQGFNLNNFFSPNIQRDKPWSALINVTVANFSPGSQFAEVLRRTGRYWIHRVFDHFGPWVNETETRWYQFFVEREAEPSYVRNRWAWVDSLGGVKEQRMMARRKPCRFSTFVVQTQRRQWLDNGAGAAMAIPNGAFAVQHRTSSTDSFGGDTNTSLPLVNWVAGEYPGHPSVNLTAFETAVDAEDATTIANMVENWPGVWYTLPTQSHYKWHRFRWLLNAPTFGAAKPRMVASSHRITSYHPNAWGNERMLPPCPGCGPGDNPIIHNTSVSDDHEVTYTPSGSVQCDERELITDTHFGDFVRLNATFTSQVENYTYHPLSDVPYINTTEVRDRYRKRTTTQTVSPRITITSIAATDPLWQWKAYQFRDPSWSFGYQTVQPQVRLSRVYGPLGQADVEKAFPYKHVAWGGPGACLVPQFENAVGVEGFDPHIKPIVIPNPITITLTNPATYAFVPLTISYSAFLNPANERSDWFISQRVVASDGFFAANLRLEFAQQFGGGAFGLSAEHHAVWSPGSFSFTIRVYANNTYSDPVAVTVNVLPPPPP